jgi:proteasome lid subunit RPN8/RPN11
VGRLQIKKEVVEKIKEEEKKHGDLEFGGYLLIENNEIIDVVFDVEEQSHGYVRFGTKSLMKIPKEQQNKVRGWFHKHPITGLSGLDMRTAARLTKFWGECVTLVLQSNGQLLLIKTVLAKDFLTKYPVYAETFRDEIPYCEQVKEEQTEYIG